MYKKTKLNTNRLIILLISIMVCPLFIGIKSISAAGKEISIKTTSNGILFNTENLKPGDWIPRNITISNNGKQDFKYIAKIGKSKSTKGLFEELDLLVQKESETLFKGKLKDFTGFTPLELSVGSSDTLLFEVKMPTHLDNSFQGAKAEVEIIFLAEGMKDIAAPIENAPNSGDTSITETTIEPKMVNKLPNTATNNYNILFFGGLLILFGGAMLFWKRKDIRLRYH